MIDRIRPDSPFIYAIQCILALIPNDADPAPKSLGSRSLRRAAAARLAKHANERVEELLTEAGEQDDRLPTIDCVQALSLLGLYEFGQTGNAARNRMKMNQSVELAMELGLHQVDKARPFDSRKEEGRTSWGGPAMSRSDEELDPTRKVEGADIIRDMKRRTWWVVYGGMMISGLVAAKVGRLCRYGARNIVCNSAIHAFFFLPTAPNHPSSGQENHQ